MDKVTLANKLRRAIDWVELHPNGESGYRHLRRIADQIELMEAQFEANRPKRMRVVEATGSVVRAPDEECTHQGAEG